MLIHAIVESYGVAIRAHWENAQNSHTHTHIDGIQQYFSHKHIDGR